MGIPSVRWLLYSEPREVQLEALRRSYYGYRLREGKDAEEEFKMHPRGLVPAKGWGHFMEMRLGKTPTALNEFMLFLKDHGFKRMVVLSPNSFKQGWIDEAEKSAFELPFGMFETSRDQDAWNFARQTKGQFGIAINYESLQYEKTQAFLSEYIDDRTYVAADESIKIKNQESITTKVALEIAKYAGVLRTLSGLPMTQGPQDLYTQLRFNREIEGVNFYAFRNKYTVRGGYKGKQVKAVKNEDKLNQLIRNTSFLAKRREWGTPGASEYYTVMLQLNDLQRKHYDNIDKEFITVLENGTEISVNQVISKLLKMQQISSGFVYTPDGEAIEIMDPLKTPKVEKLLEMAEEEIEGKFIVPYHYGKSGDILLKSLAKYKPAIIRSAEWMRKNGRNIDDEKRRFNGDHSCRAMILQISAGKYGHDLSGIEGDRCGTMVFYEQTYSLDDRGQIEMRNTTAFQNWTNVYLDLVSSKVEQSAVEAIIRKESLVTAVLGAYNLDKERKTM